MARPYLSQAERAILSDLLLLHDAVAPDFLPPEQAAAIPRLLRLGLVTRHHVRLSRPEMGGPLFTFPTDSPDPDSGRVAWTLRKRWDRLRPTSFNIFVATSKAANILGGRAGRIRNPHHLEHDLAVAATHYCLLNDSSLIWVPERSVAHFLPGCDVLFDGLLVDQGNIPTTAVEIGGRYGKRRIQNLWTAAQLQRVSLEIW